MIRTLKVIAVFAMILFGIAAFVLGVAFHPRGVIVVIIIVLLFLIGYAANQLVS